jgi:hypothetical protein
MNGPPVREVRCPGACETVRSTHDADRTCRRR